jgi:hypothetical protein
MTPLDEHMSLITGLIIIAIFAFIVVASFQLGVMVGIAAGEAHQAVHLKL